MESNDVHIVTGPDAAAAYEAYTREQARRLVDQQLRHLRETAALSAADEKRELVRDEVGRKMLQALEWLEPYVDGSMGEVTAGLAAVYMRGLKDLASLYGAQHRPRLPVAAPPLPVVEPVAAAEEVRRQVEASSAAARDAVRGQLEAVRSKLGGKPGQG